MEKFGIFELLDTLSALSAAKSDSPRPVQDTQREEEKTDFPPDLPQNPPPAPSSKAEREQNALNDFFARHERISKQIDKNK